jgi:hypothetical protein
VDATPVGATPQAYLLVGELTDEGVSYQTAQLSHNAMINIRSIAVVAP